MTNAFHTCRHARATTACVSYSGARRGRRRVSNTTATKVERFPAQGLVRAPQRHAWRSGGIPGSIWLQGGSAGLKGVNDARRRGHWGGRRGRARSGRAAAAPLRRLARAKPAPSAPLSHRCRAQHQSGTRPPQIGGGARAKRAPSQVVRPFETLGRRLDSLAHISGFAPRADGRADRSRGCTHCPRLIHSPTLAQGAARRQPRPLGEGPVCQAHQQAGALTDTAQRALCAHRRHARVCRDQCHGFAPRVRLSLGAMACVRPPDRPPASAAPC